ncbi:MAG: hypothetical protein GEU90_21950 [Gemmatimonas sp.]|nr:hypothetical protein [Gemmatimonas sp.]
MFSYQLYNLVHIVGLVLVMAGLGGMIVTVIAGGEQRSVWARRSAAAFHGLGIFLILLGGFGMLARLGLVRGTPWPGWVWVKAFVWGTLALAAFLPYRYPKTAKPLLLLLPVLGGFAAYMAIYKPL